jgi:hypothetical protein
MKIFFAAGMAAAFLCANGCKTPSELAMGKGAEGGDDRVTYTINAEGEIIPSNEILEFKDGAKLIQNMQFKNREARGDNTGDKHIRRGFHAKGHACVQGQFKVDPNIPAEFQRGMFSFPGHSYRAWVRFSNGNPRVQPDYSPDFRGLGIKVMGVDGERLLSSKDAPGTPEEHMLDPQMDRDSQDLLMLANPRMVAGSGARFLEFTRASQLPTKQFAQFLAANPDIAAFLAEFQLFRYFDSARYAEFFSGSALKYGEKIVHYKVKPCAGQVPKFNEALHKANFALVQAMIAAVANLSQLTEQERNLFGDLREHLTGIAQFIETRARQSLSQIPVPKAWLENLKRLEQRSGEILGALVAARGKSKFSPGDELISHMSATMRSVQTSMEAYFIDLAKKGDVDKIEAILDGISKAHLAQSAPLRDYLRHDLTRALESESICYDFMVQLPPKAAAKLPSNPTAADLNASYVENASIQWQEADSPFTKVATLTITPRQLPTLPPLADGMRPHPPQGCDAGASKEECDCEKFNWSPWNGIAEHRPLGSINRIRKFVYHTSQFNRSGDH